MDVGTLLQRCRLQLRLTPLVSLDDLRLLLKQAVRQVSVDCKFLEDWFIILCKKDTSRYFLPQNHLLTTAVFYDKRCLMPVLGHEVPLLSADSPLYYTEDDWQDEAGSAKSSEFVIHMALNDLWPLQLMRSQSGFGRKVITILRAPLQDGEIPSSAPVLGWIEWVWSYWQAIYGQGNYGSGWTYGETESVQHWPRQSGAFYQLLATSDNLTVFCRVADEEPTVDSVTYNDLLSVLYLSKTLSLALSSEDDESDQVRSLIYEEIARAGAEILRSCWKKTQ
jgi:hypothetical protein